MKVFKSLVSKHFSQGATLGELLTKISNLPEEEVRDAARKGAVWIQRGGKGKILRIREISERLKPADSIQFFYDAKVLKLPSAPKLECIYEDSNYGVWVKPAGIVPQGTQTGDHASLLRSVEITKKKEVFLVHRLDRETKGLMLVAYTSRAAAMLSDLFQKNKIHKTYEAIVLGEMERGHRETIKASLDDKEAITHIEVLGNRNGKSLVRAIIETGRLHQIRRHLDFIGHPIMGDPKYGQGNKNKEGLKLEATGMSFMDPWLKEIQNFQLKSSLTV